MNEELNVSASLIEMYLGLPLMTYFHDGGLGECSTLYSTIQWSELNVSASQIEMYLGLLTDYSVLNTFTNAGIEVQLKFLNLGLIVT